MLEGKLRRLTKKLQRQVKNILLTNGGEREYKDKFAIKSKKGGEKEAQGSLLKKGRSHVGPKSTNSGKSRDERNFR